jgi:hypothetical protein
MQRTLICSREDHDFTQTFAGFTRAEICKKARVAGWTLRSSGYLGVCPSCNQRLGSSQYVIQFKSDGTFLGKKRHAGLAPRHVPFQKARIFSNEGHAKVTSKYLRGETVTIMRVVTTLAPVEELV